MEEFREGATFLTPYKAPGTQRSVREVGSPTRAQALRAGSSCGRAARVFPEPGRGGKTQDLGGGTGTPQSPGPCAPQALASLLGPGKAGSRARLQGGGSGASPRRLPGSRGPAAAFAVEPDTGQRPRNTSLAQASRSGTVPGLPPASLQPLRAPHFAQPGPHDPTSRGPERLLTCEPPSRKLRPPLPLCGSRWVLAPPSAVRPRLRVLTPPFTLRCALPERGSRTPWTRSAVLAGGVAGLGTELTLTPSCRRAHGSHPLSSERQAAPTRAFCCADPLPRPLSFVPSLPSPQVQDQAVRQPRLLGAALALGAPRGQPRPRARPCPPALHLDSLSCVSQPT
ncbi:transcription initiation factor TFIID subunit 4-like [Pongo abelii]|uniref:transcription initiation factor TFIID subunit 4-like n=1 Tax=Pongo abelii TaxID=9601 RepID=UPI003004C813